MKDEDLDNEDLEAEAREDAEELAKGIVHYIVKGDAKEAQTLGLLPTAAIKQVIEDHYLAADSDAQASLNWAIIQTGMVMSRIGEIAAEIIRQGWEQGIVFEGLDEALASKYVLPEVSLED